MNLETAKDIILRSYFDCRKKKSPYFFLPGKGAFRVKLDKSVEKAATLCIANNLDPVIFVQAQYKYHTTDEFFETCLCPKNALGNYQRFTTKSVLVLANSFEVQMSYLKTAIVNLKMPVEEILMDEYIQFTPWFRITITKQINPKVIKKYGKLAKLACTPELIAFLKSKNLDPNRIKDAK